MIDKESATDFLHYLARSADKTRTQIHAQHELAEQLNVLKNTGTLDLQNRVNVLEKRIGSKRKNQNAQECIIDESFQDRLVTVEQKIDAYLHAEQLRAERIHELEEKMKLRSASPNEKAKVLAKTTHMLSLLQARATRLGKSTKSAALREKILRIKACLKNIKT